MTYQGVGTGGPADSEGAHVRRRPRQRHALRNFAEAFAATCLKFQRDLKIDDARLNPNGGTLAMGHAFAATGPILAANCLGELERRGERFGVIAVSGAAGLGSATVLERIA
ncbi:hypothetical protein ACIBW9_36700 [Streptomyces sp. NPDC049541]|uniref:hypothetical protein n=1 Tax=Streptomyces sp. NPDC049541 TaxID=3365594 RepID=UPI0037B5B237